MRMGTQTRNGRLSAAAAAASVQPPQSSVPRMTWRERIMQYIDATERSPRSPSPTIITTSSTPSAASASDTSRQRAVGSNATAATNADSDYGSTLPTFETEGGKKIKPISVAYRRNLAWMIMAAFGLVTMLAMYRRSLAHQYHQHQRFEGAAPTMTSYVDPEPTTPRQVSPLHGIPMEN